MWWLGANVRAILVLAAMIGAAVLWWKLRPARLEPGARERAAGVKTEGHKLIVTKPAPMQVGMPARPIPEDVLQQMRFAIDGTGADRVYWFWMSIAGDQPHLGLAVSPHDSATANRLGQAIEPIWRKCRPDNSVFDILPLDDPKMGEMIVKSGKLLYSRHSLE